MTCHSSWIAREEGLHSHEQLSSAIVV